MALQNEWHHRKVAEGQAKACWICFKPSTSVLITPDQKDFFYICLGHLKDRGFATPDADEAAAVEERKKKEALEREKQAVIKEYADKLKEKEKKRKERDKKKDKTKDEKKEDKKEDEEEDKKDEKERDEKIKSLEQKEDAKTDDGPRIFNLHKSFYQQRVQRLRDIEQAKRNRERLKNPSTFPSVPTGDL